MMNPQLELAESYVGQTGVSVFLTGKAGTGKTTFLRHVTETIKKRYVIVAPTGVAAVNAGGVTIHSFFQLPLCPYLPDVPELVTEYQMPEEKFQMRKERLRIIRTLELLIIDEISMVRADLLDAVDMILRRTRRSSRPFGGVQLLMIGDVHQLPPVVRDDEKVYMDRVYPSPFFFHSKALRQVPYVTIELQKVYRQQDMAFVDLLNRVRGNCMDQESLQRLNSRYIPGFDPDNAKEQYIRLTTHNHQADAVNRAKMAELKTEERLFSAKIEGSFPDSCLPTDQELVLKIGEQVMFVKNDSSGGHRYYNGKVGTIRSFEEEGVSVADENGDTILVGTEEWSNIKYEINPVNNEIEGHLDGLFVQVPLRPAWAITIHKAQGLTFDHVVVDAAAAFAFGQVYVALSRCRSLEGLVLSSQISPQCLFGNGDVEGFCSHLPSEDQMREILPSCRQAYRLDLLGELFSFESVYRQAEKLNTLFQSSLASTYPEKAKVLSMLTIGSFADLMGVGERFARQLQRMSAAGESLDDRIAKGAEYYLDQLAEIGSKIHQLMGLDVDNKEVAKQYKELSSQLLESFGLKRACFKQVKESGFTVEGYQKTKVDFILEKEQKPKKADEFEGLAHPELAKRLRKWRYSLSQENNCPAYSIMSQRSLISIANILPRTMKELSQVEAFGKTRQRRYGSDIIEIVKRYCGEQGLEPQMISMDSEEEPVEERGKKSAKEPAYRRSLRLVAAGKGVDEVAAELGVTVSTVGEHLKKGYLAGEIDIDLILTDEEQEEMAAYFLEEHPSGLKEAYTHFAGRYPYYKVAIAARYASTLE